MRFDVLIILVLLAIFIFPIDITYLVIANTDYPDLPVCARVIKGFDEAFSSWEVICGNDIRYVDGEYIEGDLGNALMDVGLLAYGCPLPTALEVNEWCERYKKCPTITNRKKNSWYSKSN